MWKKRLIQGLWIAIGISTVVLLGAAMQKKNLKVCTDVRIEITGAEKDMFIDENDILNILNASGNIIGTEIAAVKLQPMEAELEANPWVKNAELFFDNKQMLVVSIEERQPIARVFTNNGSSFYLDTANTKLPLSQKVSARVPVFTGHSLIDKPITSADSLVFKSIIKLAGFITNDSFWMAQIAQVDVHTDVTFQLIPVIGDHVIEIGNVNNLEQKFDRLYTFYTQAWMQNGINKYEKLDVQFNNQIVAVKKGMGQLFADSLKAKQLANNIVNSTSDSLFTSLPKMPAYKSDSVNKIIVKPINKNTIVKKDIKPPTLKIAKPIINKNTKQKPGNNKPKPKLKVN